ncbi:hypothetical protein BTHE68_41230 [Burkholderia sp. THE68]|uniref:hypothetical protein n=1 Tax=Burkholderia sp. THE68 TaxID=758782 RepID=UPI001318183D|nr:hypothetical protein [Burkholderia sp. THE68]BBU30389.1 hypothetical protein BTHE68_41230 [Burkholderia sp. THE68]
MKAAERSFVQNDKYAYIVKLSTGEKLFWGAPERVNVSVTLESTGPAQDRTIMDDFYGRLEAYRDTGRTIRGSNCIVYVKLDARVANVFAYPHRKEGSKKMRKPQQLH